MKDLLEFLESNSDNLYIFFNLIEKNEIKEITSFACGCADSSYGQIVYATKYGALALGTGDTYEKHLILYSFAN